MTPEAFDLLAALAGGAAVSGQALARERGVTRAAVWKQVRTLRDCGLPVEAVPGVGYRLPWPLELLDPAEIGSAIGASPSIEVRPVVDSTNAALAREFRHRHGLVAEYQTRGRGRRGRGWIAPPACGLCLSFGFRFQCGLPRLGPMSLVAGIAAADAVAETAPGVRLKWPNDLMVDDRKLGGLLIEVRGASDGPCEIVIGVGLNVRLPQAGQVDRDNLPDQPWTDLAACSSRYGQPVPGRNRLAANLVTTLDRACERFERDGFDPFADRWRVLDALDGRPVRVTGADGSVITGVAGGVTDQGALRVRHNQQIIELNAGEVSVRVD